MRKKASKKPLSSCKKTISPRIYEVAENYFLKNFRSVNAGAEYVLHCFKPLHRAALDEITGTFTENELKLMIDVFNDTILTPDIAGQQLTLNVPDAIKWERYNEKWNVDKDKMIVLINGITSYQRAALEIWAKAFWLVNEKHEQDEELPSLDLDAYVSKLL